MKSAPKTILEIYEQFVNRREALIKALVDGTYFNWGDTTEESRETIPYFNTYNVDRDNFYHQCDPDKENLCLYGAFCFATVCRFRWVPYCKSIGTTGCWSRVGVKYCTYNDMQGIQMVRGRLTSPPLRSLPRCQSPCLESTLRGMVRLRFILLLYYGISLGILTAC